MTSEGAPAPQALDARGLRVGVCASRFNDEVTARLVDGATRALEEAGAAVVGPHWVSGAFELPLVALALASAGCDAVVALGCIIRGETPHFDLIASESARGLMEVMLETGVPVGNGIITTENREQADARTAAGDNKGAEAARAALEARAALDAVARG